VKTKLSEPIPTAFPTCGEVFHYLITALDLTAWADVFHDRATKRRAAAEIGALSDQLRDWAAEADGRAPKREEFERFIRAQVRTLPSADKLDGVLCTLWHRALDAHAHEVLENATFLDRAGTRAWCARRQAPGTLTFLWAMQKLLRRLAHSAGPVLDRPLGESLAKAWADSAGAAALPNHPLQLACYSHYAELRTAPASSVDARTLSAWKSGEARPSCESLGRHFSNVPDKLGLVLNFAFAGLLEAMAHTLWASIPTVDWPDCRQLLLGQAGCIQILDEAVAEALASTPDMSLVDYERLLASSLGDYGEFLMRLPRSGVNSLDLRNARFRVYEEYRQRFLETQVPPRGFGEFCSRLESLWQGTKLTAPRMPPSIVEAELAKLRAVHPDFSTVLAGPLLAIEARLAVCSESPTQGSLQRALTLYQRAFIESRYRAGSYTVIIAREALGLAALLHRRETGEGTIKPWIKNVLDWWDLLGLGMEFDHERLEQRIELAESRFTDRLHQDVRARLRLALPQLGLLHRNIGGQFGFSEPGVLEKLKSSPIDRRQKKPMSKTIVGRDQTVLMEAIDRDQLDLARELVRAGNDLNFINSTGDTCVTKAFARKDYTLVLEILRRDTAPIRRATVLRVTSKKRISGLEQALSHGQSEILREMAEPKPGLREEIDMNVVRIWDQTPLYYAVGLIAHHKMGAKQAFEIFSKAMPTPVNSKPQLEEFNAIRKALAAEFNFSGVLRCIHYLANELRVDLDTPNANDYSALTYAVECGLHDVAAMLLAAGANVNHRFVNGGTALVHAIVKDDFEMAKLLIEYRADARLFVEAIGRPIFAMNMSERMRRLIPFLPQ
jgi:ankyrin repeat protein